MECRRSDSVLEQGAIRYNQNVDVSQLIFRSLRPIMDTARRNTMVIEDLVCMSESCRSQPTPATPNVWVGSKILTMTAQFTSPRELIALPMPRMRL